MSGAADCAGTTPKVKRVRRRFCASKTVADKREPKARKNSPGTAPKVKRARHRNFGAQPKNPCRADAN